MFPDNPIAPNRLPATWQRWKSVLQRVAESGSSRMLPDLPSNRSSRGLGELPSPVSGCVGCCLPRWRCSPADGLSCLPTRPPPAEAFHESAREYLVVLLSLTRKGLGAAGQKRLPATLVIVLRNDAKDVVMLQDFDYSAIA